MQLQHYLAVLSTSLFLICSTGADAQCPTGSIGVSGAGCGCLSGCNLTSFGGPNCSPAVSGNCSAGQVSMSQSISVPAGCTYTVTATMQNRGGSCSASGADSGDQLKVDASGGGKSFQTGSGNASISDSYTLAGPGTIIVSGTANRADEIITYSTTFSGAACVNCATTLPIELIRFDAFAEGDYVVCSWETASELNNDYFTVERSADGEHFEAFGQMDGAGNSQQPLHYKLYDSSPLKTIISYYRLAQTDFDGTTTYSEIRAVVFDKPETPVIYPNPNTGNFTITGSPALLETIRLTDASGRSIAIPRHSGPKQLFITDLPAGMYLINYLSGGASVSEKIIVSGN